MNPDAAFYRTVIETSPAAARAMLIDFVSVGRFDAAAALAAAGDLLSDHLPLLGYVLTALNFGGKDGNSDLEKSRFLKVLLANMKIAPDSSYAKNILESLCKSRQPKVLEVHEDAIYFNRYQVLKLTTKQQDARMIKTCVNYKLATDPASLPPGQKMSLLSIDGVGTNLSSFRTLLDLGILKGMSDAKLGEVCFYAINSGLPARITEMAKRNCVPASMVPAVLASLCGRITKLSANAKSDEFLAVEALTETHGTNIASLIDGVTQTGCAQDIMVGLVCLDTTEAIEMVGKMGLNIYAADRHKQNSLTLTWSILKYAIDEVCWRAARAIVAMGYDLNRKLDAKHSQAKGPTIMAYLSANTHAPGFAEFANYCRAHLAGDAVIAATNAARRSSPARKAQP